jgi:hypothetical protein
MVGWRRDGETEEILKEIVLKKSIQYSGFFLEELQETTKENPLRMDNDPAEIRNRRLPNTGLCNKTPYSFGT